MKLIFKIILLQIVIGASFNGIVAQYAYSGGNCATHSGDTVPLIPVI